MSERQFNLFLAFFILFISLVYSCEPDCKRNVTELISSKGYNVSDHEVVTADGYVLTIQRILPRRKLPGPPKVALLQHGLLGASHDWVLNSPNQSLGFILSDQGYDVWLGNVRGNTYGKKHTQYPTNSKKFWIFSFDEMAKYDLPAMIDYILNTMKQPSLSYIGHSQGTIIAFALLSQNPSYNSKIKIFAGLGPVATVGYITSPIHYLAPISKELIWFLDLLGEYDFLPSNKIINWLSKFCPDAIAKTVCENIYFVFNGVDMAQFNETRSPVYFSHDPAGTSTYNILHWAQMVKSKKFAMFDWGKAGNFHHYHQLTPPEYDVSKIKTPVALYWGLNDVLADPKDVSLLSRKLTNLVVDYRIPDPKWGHVDFIFGIDAASLVYKPLIALLEHYNQ